MKDINLDEIQKMNVQDLGSWTGKVWKKTYKLVLVVFWMLMIAVGSYFWYLSFYGPSWSDADKESFLRSKFSENNLNRDLLEKVLKDMESKQEKFEREVFDVKNIFKIY